ncbi:Avirulence (Avh) protein [Phytophthora cinnamomi]|uniref:Avirulence (Avh) protein n=1 Tax=Phytophthora cinnamomi TaxID=4785 RepID=UPI00355A2DE9|nr:Avirulence (Avh) protein [Phytophthora cinnamomi]
MLENPKFKTWAAFMSATNKQNLDAAMISALSTRYSDDVLSQMIIAAKQVPDTKELATKLQAGQASIWLSSEKSADDVFSLLKLNKANGNVLDNSEFAAWTKYVDDLNKNDVEKPALMMSSTLASRYSDEAIMKMVEAAKTAPDTKCIAKRLETVQPPRWLSSNKSPVDMFKRFGLKADENLLTNPKSNSWVKYLHDSNTKNPEEKTTMLATFTAYYGDEGL